VFDSYAIRFLTSYLSHPAGAEHELRMVPNATNIDIGIFQRIAREESADRIMFLGSYARVRYDDWLAKHLDAIEPDDVAMVAPNGSWEQGYSTRLPNPHLRTSNFMVKPALLNALGLPVYTDKRECYEFEHGDASVYRQFTDAGLRCLVVGQECSYGERAWPDSGTFRVPGQPNLLIADKQSDAYDAAGPDEKRDLERRAWSAS
jgi:hypothetical protein